MSFLVSLVKYCIFFKSFKFHLFSGKLPWQLMKEFCTPSWPHFYFVLNVEYYNIYLFVARVITVMSITVIPRIFWDVYAWHRCKCLTYINSFNLHVSLEVTFIIIPMFQMRLLVHRKYYKINWRQTRAKEKIQTKTDWWQKSMLLITISSWNTVSSGKAVSISHSSF